MIHKKEEFNSHIGLTIFCLHNILSETTILSLFSSQNLILILISSRKERIFEDISYLIINEHNLEINFGVGTSPKNEDTCKTANTHY